VGQIPFGVAVTPDGKYAFVTTQGPPTVTVVDTATNTVAATVALPAGSQPTGVAITPDGKHAYVANLASNVSVVDTTTNPPSVVATVALPAGSQPGGVAITPDGKHAYVTNEASNTVWVIDTATNPPSVVATVTVGVTPFTVAVTPDGKHAYVANHASDNVSVIDTTTNPPTAVATVAVQGEPYGVAITPDGKHAYVANLASNSVSVIDTTTNPPMVVSTVPLPTAGNPVNVGIVPPPQSVPFRAFHAELQIAFGRAPNRDVFALESSFTLSSTAPGINPVTQPVTLMVGTFITTVPPGSFKQIGRLFTFAGVIDGVSLEAQIKPTGTLRYAFGASAQGASLTGTTNPVPVSVSIGKDAGRVSVNAVIVKPSASGRDPALLHWQD
jgi:YVTN family beta-propeller protein